MPEIEHGDKALPRNGGQIALSAGLPFGRVASAHLFRVALAADTPALRGYPSVLWREFMAALAMCASALPCAVRPSAKRQPRSVPSFVAGYDIGIRQTLLGSLHNRINLRSRNLRQDYCAVGVPLDSHMHSAPLVPLLGFFVCPPTVGWRIGAVVVNAVKRVAGRSVPHVFGKCRKGIPPLADGDAAPSVVRPCLGASAEASTAHSLPDGIERVRIFERQGASPKCLKTLAHDAMQRKGRNEHS